MWFEGLLSVAELKIPKKCPGSAPGNFGEGESVKARPKPPGPEPGETIAKTKCVLKEDALGYEEEEFLSKKFIGLG